MNVILEYIVKLIIIKNKFINVNKEIYIITITIAY